MNSFQKAIHELEAQKDNIEAAIRTLRTLNGTGSIAGTGRRTHRMSAEGRARIAAAARKRWAKIHAEAKK